MIWIIAILVVVLLLFYKYGIKPYKFWSSIGVQQDNLLKIYKDVYDGFVLNKTFADVVYEQYFSFPGTRYIGLYQFWFPMFLVKDPDLIKLMTVKDFDHFSDHVQFIPENLEPLWEKNLLALNGQKWKDMRATLSPSFTGSKMKLMFVLMQECAKEYSERLLKDCPENPEYEMRDLFSRFANDVIATTAFGIKVNSYTERNNEFYVMGRSVTNFSGIWNNLKFFIFTLLPSVAKFFEIGFFPRKPAKFFTKLVIETLRTREQQGIVRPDMIHLLMEARKGRDKEDVVPETETGFATVQESEIGKAKKVQTKEKLTDIDICAQALIFFFAGFDSVSTLMAFMAYELAVNPNIQDRLREEIKETLKKCDGKVSYDVIMSMKYMDMVVSESLRKWPNAIALDRTCTVPYEIKPVNPGEKTVVLPKGANLFVPVYGIHRDPEFYPDPERFDPERFNEENKGKINIYTYMPFGVGPRNCIGSRFALMEIKIIFFYLLEKMEMVPNAKTPIPMKLQKTSFQLIADPGFYVDLKSL